MCGSPLAYRSAGPAARWASTDPHSVRFRGGRPDEDRLTEDIIELARQYDRYGYRPVTELLNQSGWHVNHKRVERIWKREGLKVPPKHKKKRRLWLNDGSCIQL